MSAPIGVFDSGVGGLTVVRELIGHFPNESIVYFGDTARVPYGIKSKETVTRFAVQDVKFLMRFKPKMVIAACNTASANAIDTLETMFECPVLDVVRPGASQACTVTSRGRIGLIATEATVESKAYDRAIQAIDPKARVFGRACPLFVPLVEEGRSPDDPIVKAVAWEYLSAFTDLNIDTLILGCTHYPVIRDAIAEYASGVIIVDSASATAKAISDRFSSLLETERSAEPIYTFYASDHPERFRRIGRKMTGLKLDNVHGIDISEILEG